MLKENTARGLAALHLAHEGVGHILAVIAITARGGVEQLATQRLLPLDKADEVAPVVLAQAASLATCLVEEVAALLVPTQAGILIHCAVRVAKAPVVIQLGAVATGATRGSRRRCGR